MRLSAAKSRISKYVLAEELLKLCTFCTNVPQGLTPSVMRGITTVKFWMLAIISAQYHLVFDSLRGFGCLGSGKIKVKTRKRI